MRILILFVCTFMVVPSPGQHNKITILKFCNYSGKPCEETDRYELDRIEMPATSEILQIARHVIEVISLSKQPVYLSTDIRGIMAMYSKPSSTEPLVILNTKKAEEWTKSQALGVLFHELGHFYNDHENMCSNKDLEEDADYFAGYCLAIAGLPKSEITKCIDLLGDESNDSHPDKAARIEKMQTGYANRLKNLTINSYTSITPNITWKKISDHDSMKIQIDDRAFYIPLIKYYQSFNDTIAIDMKLGMLYVKSTHGTYQLYDTQKDQGIGRLVNDRTNIVFIRTKKNAFKVFDKGKIIRKVNTLTHGASPNNPDDYFAVFTDSQKYLFVNYFYAPVGTLMPAFAQ